LILLRKKYPASILEPKKKSYPLFLVPERVKNKIYTFTKSPTTPLPENANGPPLRKATLFKFN